MRRATIASEAASIVSFHHLYPDREKMMNSSADCSSCHVDLVSLRLLETLSMFRPQISNRMMNGTLYVPRVPDFTHGQALDTGKNEDARCIIDEVWNRGHYYSETIEVFLRTLPIAQQPPSSARDQTYAAAVKLFSKIDARGSRKVISRRAV